MQPRNCRIVAILAVQWGYPGDRVRPWFRINPYNHSGRRLIQIIGHTRFMVTNACPQLVCRASQQGTPDALWLQNNLSQLAPELVLVCGKVAQATFKRDMVGPGVRVLKLPHPAARTWTKRDIARWAKRVQEACW
jgi:hypothetical protein